MVRAKKASGPHKAAVEFPERAVPASGLTDSPDAAGYGHAPVGRDDVEALARSSVALTDGVEAIGRELFEFHRQSLTAGLATMRALIDARNIEDVAQLQHQYLRGRVESLVREGGRLAVLAGRIASETWQPLRDHAAGKAAKPAGG